MSIVPITNALISVSDKMGLAPFAKALAVKGVTIYSTGGTRKHLESEGLEVRDIADYTGFPEMMDGRVKTLHPKVFGGILCRHDRGDDMDALKQHGIGTFELVVVNLYPFEATIAKPGVTPSEAIEQIDIGGPSLVRARAKNHAFTSIATSPEQYAAILTEFETHGGTTLELRKKLAAAAFARTAEYDRAIADYFAQHTADADFPTTYCAKSPPQRSAALRRKPAPARRRLRRAEFRGREPRHGAAAQRQRAVVQQPARSRRRAGDRPRAAALRPRRSSSTTTRAAPRRRRRSPKRCARPWPATRKARSAASSASIARSTPRRPKSSPSRASSSKRSSRPTSTPARWRFSRRSRSGKPTCGCWRSARSMARAAPWQSRRIDGGMLVQDADFADDPETEWKVVTEKQPTPAQLADLRFAWAIVRHVKSNAIRSAKSKCSAASARGK